MWLSVQGRAGLFLSSSCFPERRDAIHFLKLLLSALCTLPGPMASGEQFLSHRQHSGVDLLPPILCLSYSLKGLQFRLGSSTVTKINVSSGLRACRDHGRPIGNFRLPGPQNFRANLQANGGIGLSRVMSCQDTANPE